MDVATEISASCIFRDHILLLTPMQLSHIRLVAESEILTAEWADLAAGVKK